jgi:hypothetical protein
VFSLVADVTGTSAWVPSVGSVSCSAPVLCVSKHPGSLGTEHPGQGLLAVGLMDGTLLASFFFVFERDGRPLRFLWRVVSCARACVCVCMLRDGQTPPPPIPAPMSEGGCVCFAMVTPPPSIPAPMS